MIHRVSELTEQDSSENQAAAQLIIETIHRGTSGAGLWQSIRSVYLENDLQ